MLAFRLDLDHFYVRIQKIPDYSVPELEKAVEKSRRFPRNLKVLSANATC